MSAGEQAALLALLSELKTSHYHRKGLRHIRRRGLSTPEKLNLGCGANRLDGFLNIDARPGGDVTLDLRRGLPFASDCAALIFSEHFLEHLAYPDAVQRLLRECLRVLRPGGTLSVSVPDTAWPITDYAAGVDAPYFRACRDHAWWHPGCTTRMEHINYHFRQDGQHRFAYDEETARALLASCGFVDVSVRDFEPGLDSERRRVGSLFLLARKSVTPANARATPATSTPVASR